MVMSSRSFARAALLLTLVCGVASGCYTVRYHTRRAAAASPVSSWNHLFFWGLAGSARVDIQAICPAGLARLETKRTFGNLFVGLLTLGLYSPTSVTVWCAADGGGGGFEERPTAQESPALGRVASQRGGA